METNAFIPLFLALGVIIAAAKVIGAAVQALGQPRIFGELLAGIVLGPSALNFLNFPTIADPHLNESVHQLAELGVLLLMFNVGLDVHLRELLSVGRVAICAGVLGALVPVALTAPVALIFGHPLSVALFAGVALAATSVSISTQTLLELGVLRTREGRGLLATAVVDDVVAILLLSVIVTTSLGEVAPQGQLVLILARIVGYSVGALALAWFVLPPLLHWLHERHIPQGMTAFALIFALLFGWSAEVLGGIAPITGAFIAGVGLSRTHEKIQNEIRGAVNSIVYAFLAPIFFVNIGLATDLRQIGLNALPFAALLLTVAVVSKILGCGLGAWLGGFENRSALRFGVCMISRGEVGLIIASTGLVRGVLNAEIFPSLFLVILLTTVLTPPLVRLAFREGREQAPFVPQPSAET